MKKSIRGTEWIWTVVFAVAVGWFSLAAFLYARTIVEFVRGIHWWSFGQ